MIEPTETESKETLDAFCDAMLEIAERVKIDPDSLHAAPVQHIGKLLVLWRPIPEKVAPEKEDRKPGPRTVKIVSFSKSGNHRATVKKVQVFGNERVTVGGQVKRARVRPTSVKKKAQNDR